MAKWKVTIRGLGKIGNDVKHINEVFELEENVIRDLRNSSKKAQVIEGLLLTRCPGVVVESNKLGLNIEEISEPLIKSKKAQEIGTAAVAGAVGGFLGAKAAKKKTKKTNSTDKKDETIPFGENLREIANYRWNGSLEETKQQLRNISLQTTGCKWEFNPNSEIEKENNRILSQCLKQYNTGYKYYKKQTDFKEMKRGLVKLKWRKIFNKYWIVILFAAILLIAFIGAMLE